MRIRSNLRVGKITIYGTDWCGWTQKQRAYLDNQGKSYTFVNCDSQACPEFVSGFPTLVADGQIFEGYKEI